MDFTCKLLGLNEITKEVSKDRKKEEQGLMTKTPSNWQEERMKKDSKKDTGKK